MRFTAQHSSGNSFLNFCENRILFINEGGGSINEGVNEGVNEDVNPRFLEFMKKNPDLEPEALIKAYQAFQKMEKSSGREESEGFLKPTYSKIITTDPKKIIYGNAGMQTGHYTTLSKTLEHGDRLYTMMIPAMLQYIHESLGIGDSSLNLGFNNVGVSIQKRYEDTDKMYENGTKNIDHIAHVMGKFGVKNYDIWRDDSKDFHDFLKSYIPNLIAIEYLKIETLECLVCEDCNDIIKLQESETFEKNKDQCCNVCSSKNLKVREEDVLTLSLPPLNVKEMQGNIISKESKDKLNAIKSWGLVNGKMLASRRNRIGGFSLEDMGLKGQFLDPSFALSLHSAHIQSKEKKGSLHVISTGELNKIFRMMEQLTPGDNSVKFAIHPKVPNGTVEKFFNSGEAGSLQFLFKNLTIKLLNNSKNLTEKDIDDLWKSFINRRSSAVQFYHTNKKPYDINTKHSYLGKEDVLSPVLTSEGYVNPLGLNTVDKEISSIISKAGNLPLNKTDAGPVLEEVNTFYGVSEKEDPLHYSEKIRHSLFELIMSSNIKSAKKIKSIMHFGSSINSNKFKQDSSDFDFSILIKDFELDDYKELKTIFQKLQNEYPNTELDFDIHEDFELLNKDSLSTQMYEANKGDKILTSIASSGRPLFGKNFAEKYVKQKKGKIQFSQSEITYKDYRHRLQHKYLTNDMDIGYFKKYSARLFTEFLLSEKDFNQDSSLLNNIDQNSSFVNKVDIFNQYIKSIQDKFNSSLFDLSKEVSSFLLDKTSIINDDIVVSLLILSRELDKYINKKYEKQKIEG